MFMNTFQLASLSIYRLDHTDKFGQPGLGSMQDTYN